MHPETAQVIVARRTEELRATARAAALIRQARGGRAAAALSLATSAPAAVGTRNARRRQALRRLIPGRAQPS